MHVTPITISAKRSHIRALIKRFKQELEKLKKEYWDKAFQNDETRRPTMLGFNIANSDYKKKILKLEKEIEQLKIDQKQIPDRIAVKHLLAEYEIPPAQFDSFSDKIN